MSDERTVIKPKPLCDRCRSNLIHKSKFKMTDPWMALEMATMLVLARNVLDDKKYLIKYGSDVEGINRIECLGCFLPDTLNKVIEVAKTKDLEKIKVLAGLK